MKFTKEGSVSMSAKLDNGRLSISVADTGCGMTEDEQKRIFQEFTRLKSAQGQEGFGLGLSITQKLVALLGGTMSVSSKPGEGSRFGVELPMPTNAPRQTPGSASRGACCSSTTTICNCSSRKPCCAILVPTSPYAGSHRNCLSKSQNATTTPCLPTSRCQP